MGDLLRRFWIPFLQPQELPGPDCDPVRVTLLGERLVAFRDTDGSYGLISNLCAHRNADLFFGRNEENGPALHLPRLEVRRERQLRRHAFRGRGQHLQGQDQAALLPGAGSRRRPLDLHGPAGAAAADAAEVRVDARRKTTASTSPGTCRTTTTPRQSRAASTPRTSTTSTRPSTRTGRSPRAGHALVATAAAKRGSSAG